MEAMEVAAETSQRAAIAEQMKMAEEQRQQKEAFAHIEKRRQELDQAAAEKTRIETEAAETARV